MRKHEKIALAQFGIKVLLIILGLILVATLGVFAQGSCASPYGSGFKILKIKEGNRLVYKKIFSLTR